MDVLIYFLLFVCLHLLNLFTFLLFVYSGGELFQRVIDCAEDLTEQNIAIQFIKQICQGCSYLSLKKIVHLDIKPENVVCADGLKDCLVKVHSSKIKGLCFMK